MVARPCAICVGAEVVKDLFQNPSPDRTELVLRTTAELPFWSNLVLRRLLGLTEDRWVHRKRPPSAHWLEKRSAFIDCCLPWYTTGVATFWNQKHESSRGGLPCRHGRMWRQRSSKNHSCLERWFHRSPFDHWHHQSCSSGVRCSRCWLLICANW